MNVKVKVDKNTSLRFENHSNEEVAVKLKVKGDIGLSMGYKKNQCHFNKMQLPNSLIDNKKGDISDDFLICSPACRKLQRKVYQKS